VVSQAALAHEDLAWYSAVRRVGFTIVWAVGRQLATRLPGWGPGVRGAFGGVLPIDKRAGADASCQSFPDFFGAER
jgi:hypothetical protein